MTEDIVTKQWCRFRKKYVTMVYTDRRRDRRIGRNCIRRRGRTNNERNSTEK